MIDISLRTGKISRSKSTQSGEFIVAMEEPVSAQSRVNEIVEVEIQGEHGIKPPAEAIRKAIEEWLESLSLNSYKERITYSLEISGWKCFAGKYGTTLFRVRDIPFEKSIELRVRIPEANDFLWRCFLFCPGEDVAWLIAESARPEAYACIRAISLKKETLDSYAARKGSRKLRRLQTTSKNRDKSELMVNRLSRGRGLRELCHSLRNLYGEETFFRDDLKVTVEKLTKIKFTDESVLELIEQLVEKGIIDSVITENHLPCFVATAILYERAFDYEEGLRQEEIERLKIRDENLAKSEITRGKEIKRLEERLVQEKAALESIIRERQEISERLSIETKIINQSYTSSDD